MNGGHISDIEQGKREVGIITLQVIARGLDTTMAKLLKALDAVPASSCAAESGPDNATDACH
jgi:transcriptional regulator with XRE-family HTH domain